MEKFWLISEILFGENYVYVVGIGMVVLMVTLTTLVIASSLLAMKYEGEE